MVAEAGTVEDYARHSVKMLKVCRNPSPTGFCAETHYHRTNPYFMSLLRLKGNNKYPKSCKWLKLQRECIINLEDMMKSCTNMLNGRIWT